MLKFIKSLFAKSNLPKSCSQCQHTSPFPYSQSKRYELTCDKLYSHDQLGDGYLLCIPKSTQDKRRLDSCPLGKGKKCD